MFGKYREAGARRRRIDALRELFRRRFDLQYLIYRLKWNLAPRFRYVLAFPPHLDIETTDACNLSCVMCVHGQGTVKNTGMMDLSFAKDLIDQGAGHGLYSIKFNWRGEPALNKHLAQLVKYAKDKKILEVQINTNGLRFTEGSIRSLIEAGIDRVIFSVDGATKETYEKIRVGGNFNDLVNNIKTFARIKQEGELSKPFLRVQMVRMKDNEAEVDDFIKMWRPYVDDIRVSDVTDRGQGDVMAVGDMVAVGRRPCPQPWQRLVVAKDGQVALCCADWHMQNVVGDASRQPLAEIWRGKRLNAIRKVIGASKLDDMEPCAHCFVQESYLWKTKQKVADQPKSINQGANNGD